MNKKWAKATAIRVVKTFFEAALAMITVGVPLNAIDWPNILLVSLTAAVYSLCTCFAGLPEAPRE